jgi:hypothetical protein
MFHLFMRLCCALLLVAVVLTSCESGDALHGEELRPNASADALSYHLRKDRACVVDKQRLLSALPNQWFHAQIIVQDEDGGFYELPLKKGTFAKLAVDAGSVDGPDGGTASASLVNEFGYRKNFNLQPCNVLDNYFYVVVRDATGSSIQTVVTYSISSSDLPSARELGQHHGLTDSDRIVGFSFRCGQRNNRSLERMFQYGTAYLNYLLRQHGCDAPNTWFDGRHVDKRNCIDAGTMNDMRIGRRVYAPRGECAGSEVLKSDVRGGAPVLILNHNKAKFLFEGSTGWISDLWISDEELCDSQQDILIGVTVDGEWVHQFYGYVDWNSAEEEIELVFEL